MSRLSNEYLFEYHIESGKIVFSTKLTDELDSYGCKAELIQLLKKTINSDNYKNIDTTINLPLCGEGGSVFKVVSSYLKDEKGKTHFIIGKLIDVSKEIEEKNQLILRSKLDGLTGIYNAAATKATIVECMKKKVRNQIDALIMIDCDDLKQINDTYGHLMGNWVLKNIAKALKYIFHDIDIVGRIGGDEFCVYMCDIPSVDFVRKKCEKVVERLKQLDQEVSVAISIGIATWKSETTYETLFRIADHAMYQAKQHGGSKIVINLPI